MSICLSLPTPPTLAFTAEYDIIHMMPSKLSRAKVKKYYHYKEQDLVWGSYTAMGKCAWCPCAFPSLSPSPPWPSQQSMTSYARHPSSCQEPKQRNIIITRSNMYTSDEGVKQQWASVLDVIHFSLPTPLPTLALSKVRHPTHDTFQVVRSQGQEILSVQGIRK